MERESFEDSEVACLLNENYVPIKVDKEERPDIDGLYMQVCQSMTGSGGWPLTVLMTPDQKPFYTGTYLPKRSRRGMYGLTELLTAVNRQWEEDKVELTHSAKKITRQIRNYVENTTTPKPISNENVTSEDLMDAAVRTFKKTFDSTNGGFGSAPKFPCPHNLIFLTRWYQIVPNENTLKIVETTLSHMYMGGLFDHIGFGFSRYSTDDRWLAPHFEKMLYDNALMIMAYAYAYGATRNVFYKQTATKTLRYVLNELTGSDGGFYCAQDADSEGQEGLFYVYTPDEITECLGDKDGTRFCAFFDITKKGNFEGKNIANRLHHSQPDDDAMDALLPKVYAWRQTRAVLHRDDKYLASWNGLMIGALASAYRLLRDDAFLHAAKQALCFTETNLIENDCVYTSFREGHRGGKGFLDDYAYMIFAYLELYNATREKRLLDRALKLYATAVNLFFDHSHGGFFISGAENEALILRLKETYDGAMPSGNAVMAYNMALMSMLTHGANRLVDNVMDTHDVFMRRKASEYPAGHCFYWLSVLLREHPPVKIVCVLPIGEDWDSIKKDLPLDALVSVVWEEDSDYKLLNGKVTYYVCKGCQCYPGSNTINMN